MLLLAVWLAGSIQLLLGRICCNNVHSGSHSWGNDRTTCGIKLDQAHLAQASSSVYSVLTSASLVQLRFISTTLSVWSSLKEMLYFLHCFHLSAVTGSVTVWGTMLNTQALWSPPPLISIQHHAVHCIQHPGVYANWVKTDLDSGENSREITRKLSLEDEIRSKRTKISYKD